MTTSPMRLVAAADPAGLVQLSWAERLAFGAAAWSDPQLGAALARSGAAGCRAVVLPGLHAGDAPRGHTVCTWVLDEWELQRIGVAPDLRGRGLGSVLLSGALAAATQAGASRLMLEVAETNQAALRLYQRHGFGVDGRRSGYYRDGAAALLMSHSLAGVPAG